MKAYMENVLLKDTEAFTPRDLELACHDAYMATRTSLYIGGQAYMKQLDQTLNKGQTTMVKQTNKQSSKQTNKQKKGKEKKTKRAMIWIIWNKQAIS